MAEVSLKIDFIGRLGINSCKSEKRIPPKPDYFQSKTYVFQTNVNQAELINSGTWDTALNESGTLEKWVDLKSKEKFFN
jgi:hypothetical protein